MNKVLAFGASNSRRSINRIFATYAASQLQNTEVIAVDLNDYKLPLYSPDLEREEGMVEDAKVFDRLLESVDGIVISLAEYNGNVTTAFKNLFDWLSRIGREIWKNKPMLLLATSPGGRGGVNVLKINKELMPFFGGKVIADFSLPFFHNNFSQDGIVDPALKEQFKLKLQEFQNALPE